MLSANAMKPHPKYSKFLRNNDWQFALAIVGYVFLLILIYSGWLPATDPLAIQAGALSILP